VRLLRWIGGWDRTTEEYPEDLLKEVDQAFDNVEHAIQQAGGKGWIQVYKTRIYITVPIDDIAEPVIRNMNQRCKDHRPLMTVVQVVALYKMMRIEIEAEAHLGWALLLGGGIVVFMALDYHSLLIIFPHLSPQSLLLLRLQETIRQYIHSPAPFRFLKSIRRPHIAPKNIFAFHLHLLHHTDATQRRKYTAALRWVTVLNNLRAP
jgi:enamine deaminase RidA (YjgF/YER057c/UK114 family)